MKYIFTLLITSLIFVSISIANIIEHANYNIDDSTEFIIHALYPNPAISSTEASYSIPLGKSAELVLYNLSGKQISLVNLSENKSIVNLQLKNLESGIYFIAIRHKNRLFSTKKLIVK